MTVSTNGVRMISQQSQRLRLLSTAAPTKPKKAFKKKKIEEGPSAGQLFIHAGLPLIGFSCLAAWVLKNSIEGKNKEFETSRGQASKWVILYCRLWWRHPIIWLYILHVIFAEEKGYRDYTETNNESSHSPLYHHR